MAWLICLIYCVGECGCECYDGMVVIVVAIICCDCVLLCVNVAGIGWYCCHGLWVDYVVAADAGALGGIDVTCWLACFIMVLKFSISTQFSA